MRARRVQELVSADFHAVHPDQSVADAQRLLLELQVAELLVVDAERALHGQISMTQLLAALGAGRAQEPVRALTVMPGIVLEAEQSLDEAMRALRYFVGISVPVIDNAASARLVGVVFQSSVIGAYNDAVAQARLEERGAD